ncbi:MAG: glycosyltransferase family 39 protein [Hyphomicrobiaceae bacterium]
MQDRAAALPAMPAEAELEAPANDRLAVAGLLLLHVAAWTLYGSVALGAGLIHDDMIEAWNWAQRPQLGYYKHPPLFAWVTWVWFQLFPTQDWSFYLLAATNAALGLAGAAALARFFGLAAQRRTIVALLMLTPLYGFLAMKFNANTVLIPVWPWATFFLLRSLETRTIRDGVALGVLGGLALLGKYYSLLLGVAFVLATLLSPHRRSYYRSPAPYVALLAAVLVVGPHVYWTVVNGFPTVAYALSKFHHPLSQLLVWASMTATAPIIFLTLPLLAASLAAGCPTADALRGIRAWFLERENASIAVLAALPFALTLGFGFVGHAKISLSYTIPIFFMASLVMARAIPGARGPRVARWAVGAAITFSAGIVLAAPVVAYGRVKWNRDLVGSPMKELAREAQALWHDETGKPLAYVAGSDRFVGAISFYAPDHPLYFVNFNARQAAWVRGEDLVRDGLLVVCRASSERCISYVRRSAPPGSPHRQIKVAHRWLSLAAEPVIYDLTFVLPGSWMEVAPELRDEPELSRP